MLRQKEYEQIIEYLLDFLEYPESFEEGNKDDKLVHKYIADRKKDKNYPRGNRW